MSTNREDIIDSLMKDFDDRIMKFGKIVPQPLPDEPIITVGGNSEKEYLLHMSIADKAVNILLGNKQYIGTRESLYELMGNVLMEHGFTEIRIPERTKK